MPEQTPVTRPSVDAANEALRLLSQVVVAKGGFNSDDFQAALFTREQIRSIYNALSLARDDVQRLTESRGD